MDMLGGTASADSKPLQWVIAGLEPNEDLRLLAAGEGSGAIFVPEGASSPDHTAASNADTILLHIEGQHGRLMRKADIVAYWHTPPYAMPIRLTRYDRDHATGQVIDSAIIGTKGSKDVFLRHAQATACRLVADALRGRSRGHLLPEPPAASSRPAAAWLDHQIAQWRERLLVEWWSVGSTNRSLPEIMATGQLGDIRWAYPKAGTDYLADPFPWPGKDQLLCEEMPVAGGVGRIVALPVGPDGLGAGSVLLETGRHHSYPSTFQDDGGVWMLPEDSAYGATVLYRLQDDASMVPVCSVAPHRCLADPTMFRHADKYWIACTDLDMGVHDNLCIFHAEQPEGPWRPHRLEPVKIDIRGARPAGSVFRIGSQLFRPGQDCAATYGAAITIHRIDRLTENDYLETPVRVLRPDPAGAFPDGLHTLVNDGQRTWVDGKRFVLDWSALTRKAARRLHRAARSGRRS